VGFFHISSGSPWDIPIWPSDLLVALFMRQEGSVVFFRQKVVVSCWYFGGFNKSIEAPRAVKFDDAETII